MILHPKNNYLLLQAMQENGISKGGILIPEAHIKALDQGIILEMGPNVNDDQFTVGEIVMFPKHTAFIVKTDETDFYMVLDSDIFSGDNCETIPEGGGDKENLKLNKKRKGIPEKVKEAVTVIKEERRKPIGLCNCNKFENNINCPVHRSL
jgi:co-chaperonin GroES (HSP10)